MIPKINLIEGYLNTPGRSKELAALRMSLGYWKAGPRAGRKSSPAQHSQCRAKLKADVISGYGGHCVACGETDPAVLTIDHIYDDGATERRAHTGGNRSGSATLYRWLRRFGFPKDRYQLLCFNCQWRKRAYGPDYKAWPRYETAPPVSPPTGK